jgi:hypothetical protein
MSGLPFIEFLTFGESGTMLLGLSKTNNELETEKTAGWKAVKTKHLAPFMGN